MEYTIFDPTGNITILVESDIEPACQPQVAANLLQRHPEAEQVGFVYPDATGEADLCLRMAGGEFCGNASMCAAVLYRLRQKDNPEVSPAGCVRLRVSGADRLVEVRLKALGEETYQGELDLPPALEARRLQWETEEGWVSLPVVSMEGISHCIISKESPLYTLLGEKDRAEETVKKMCRMLSAEAMGLIFLAEEEEGKYALTPLVYVPGSDTLYWEHSCGSGSCAAAWYLTQEGKAAGRISFRQPGGVLAAEVLPEKSGICLSGTVRKRQS